MILVNNYFYFKTGLISKFNFNVIDKKDFGEFFKLQKKGGFCVNLVKALW